VISRPGRVLNHRYRLEERLGQGAMGSVWKAVDTRLERTVAAKELIARRDGDEDLEVRRERVRREALALAKVEHPAIVSIHDLIYEGASQDPWIVMAYVRGRSLDSIISGPQPLGEQKVASIGLAVLQGLMACHERQVYHRDVKPGNIVLSDDGTVHLVDFGIARIVGKNSLTMDSSVLGTPEFLAPELLTDHRSGPGTDLWALGVTLYYAIERHSPFRAETLAATIAAILSKSPPEPRTQSEVGALVLTMLRKHPAERPDAATVAAVLRRVASGSPATPRSGQASRVGRRTASGTRTGSGPRAAQPSGQVIRGFGRVASGTIAASGTPAAQPAARAGQRPAEPRASRRPGATQPLSAAIPPTPLHGMPALDAAKLISDWTTDHAVTDLLSLSGTAAASILNRCDDPVAGKLLSAIAASDPDRARRILEMVTTERAGRLLDHMSSLAAASALSLAAPAGAVRVLGQADNLTATGVLLEMHASAAAGLVKVMDIERAVKLLGQAAPVTVADILRNVPGDRRQVLLRSLSEPFRSLVAKHL
jgi:tRNA A-37 threonylcarbamoyl transferase component Bud32/flagellar motility protein MotE (MotC chaperone)